MSNVLTRAHARILRLPVGLRRRLIVYIPALVAAVALSTNGIAHAAGLVQPGADVGLNFVTAVLAVPGVTVLVAALLRNVTTPLGIDPRVAVYGASYVVLAATLAITGAEMPTWGGNPHTYVMSWLAFGSANAETARRYYETLAGILALDPYTPTEK